VLTQYEKTIQTAFREVADALAVQGTIGEAARGTAIADVGSGRSLFVWRRCVIPRALTATWAYSTRQRSYFAAQQVLVALRLANLSSQVRLYTVLGGGAE
jgi:multidrug efflux system outer membrane protein